MNEPVSETRESTLYFWGIGDMHYRALPAWREVHTPRLQLMYDDLHMLWQEIGRPGFCVSPGDIVDTCAPENYAFARQCIEAGLDGVPFYPGMGNHEYHGPDGEDPATMIQLFSETWQRPPRYTWQAGGVLCVMLDYPNPHLLPDIAYIDISRETLAFLSETLETHRGQAAVIFLHSPLRNTVLPRRSQADLARDYNSTQSFFSPENSQDVRDILASHDRDCLFINGHTHTGWEAPGIVTTEPSGQKNVTYVNLMSPWYTGNHGATSLDKERQRLTYTSDDPDVVVSFAFHLHSGVAHIRARDHRSRSWLKEWGVPFKQ